MSPIDIYTNMQYKNWLISEEVKNLKYYQNLILSKLELDAQGLSKSIESWDSQKLINKLNELGEYKNLPEGKRRRVESQIRSKFGTLGDMISAIVN